MPDTSRTVEWQPWGREAFSQAEAEQKPVLLSLGAAWSLGSTAMLRTTYRDAAVSELIDRHFIPVWVDADDRPDINDRYNLGGWPTTAFLTCDGQLLGGQTFTEPEPMAALLQRVAEAFASRQAELVVSPDRSRPQGPAAVSAATDVELDLKLEPWLVGHMLDAFDEIHGGFGRASKRIQESPLSLALIRCRGGDRSCYPMVSKTLDAVGWGPLFDEVDGGVFRYAERRDWTHPHVEKLLTVNASALRLLLEGWKVLEEPRYRERAVKLIRYVGGKLADDVHDGFFASQCADDVYYQADAGDRGRLRAPEIDRVVYTGGNGEMVRAYIQAAEVLGEASLLDYAVATLERVVGETYRRGQGVAHRVDAPDQVRGLLEDQVPVSEALLDAYSAVGHEVYLDLAQELMLFAMRSLWDDRTNTFVDRVVSPDDIGLLRHTINPFALNCRAAGLLARLARHSDRPDFAAHARLTLASQTRVSRSHSVEAAWYALALRDIGFSEAS